MTQIWSLILPRSLGSQGHSRGKEPQVREGRAVIRQRWRLSARNTACAPQMRCLPSYNSLEHGSESAELQLSQHSHKARCPEKTGKPRQRQLHCRRRNKAFWVRGSGLTVDLWTDALTQHFTFLFYKERERQWPQCDPEEANQLVKVHLNCTDRTDVHWGWYATVSGHMPSVFTVTNGSHVEIPFFPTPTYMYEVMTLDDAATSRSKQ